MIKMGYANAKIYKHKNEAYPHPGCYQSYHSDKEDNPPCKWPASLVDKDQPENRLVTNIKKATVSSENVLSTLGITIAQYLSGVVYGCNLSCLMKSKLPRLSSFVHKVLQENHPVTIKEVHGQAGWLETCARTVATEGQCVYSGQIAFPLETRMFEDKEYILLKGIDDPNERCHGSSGPNQIILADGMNDHDALESLCQRFNSQHYNLRKFYYECSNLKYLTHLINVPTLGQEPPNLLDNRGAPSLPVRPKTTAALPAPPLVAPSPAPDAVVINEQACMLKQYEDQQTALCAQREAEEHQRLDLEAQQQCKAGVPCTGAAYADSAIAKLLSRSVIIMRGQFECDQLLLEQYDQQVKALEVKLSGVMSNIHAQMASKDELIK
ncbi:uncharacterized protein BJ212DRAFT_1533919 [Suillus subaureus]|uniref:AP180 N-terminal homology (ANTH) domain-containing protein n=1 Tax=Suillus subaureus TaxID=48587 RepID=A0A9P7EKS4_9AGAM|nr:uncharacterized protein BJ212DRAFT_1533919 [Suillus subaureus]KAG1823848.1 hypothetical protein BJ212DRAFT_1533919 [Suillus subaureus]